MIDTLLVLNAGSSSIKFQVFAEESLEMLAKGQVSQIGGTPRLKAGLAAGRPETRELAAGAGHEAALAAILEFVKRHDADWRMVCVAHRIVHGGTDYARPVAVTPEVMADLTALIPLAPLHQPHNLAGIVASEKLAGGVPDIACFDTAFHAGQQPLFNSFALRGSLRDDHGIRRYGFHGLSYSWIAHVLAEEHPALAAGRVVAAHLGNGASLCAIKAGASLETTMGMTALDGLPMGTRSGAIDAGAVIYMLRDLGMDASQVEKELYERSGLLGLSGISNDVETLLASPDPRARFALDYFELKVAQYAAAMAASMGGVDALVFTGGIGEHAHTVRDAIVERLRFLGDFRTLVIAADEERLMAMEAREVLKGLR